MPEVPPDLAGKALAADLRNLIKKVSDGSTLSPAEREIMERCIIDGTAPEELRKARISALLRKWAMGGKLSKEEQKEVDAFLPDRRAGSRRVTSENYQHRYRHYVKLFIAAGMPAKGGEESSIRNIKRWVKIGLAKTPADLPPFDAPEGLADWYDTNMGWAAPEWMQRLADATPPSKNPDNPVNPATKPSPTSPAKVEAGEDEAKQFLRELNIGGNDDESSTDLGVQMFAALARDTFDRLQQSRRDQHHRLAAQLTKELANQVEVLRRQQAAAIKAAEGKGESLRARVVNTELVRLFSINAQSFENALLSILEKHAAHLSADARREIASAQSDSCFDHLNRTQWATAWHQARAHLTAA